MNIGALGRGKNRVPEKGNKQKKGTRNSLEGGFFRHKEDKRPLGFEQTSDLGAKLLQTFNDGLWLVLFG